MMDIKAKMALLKKEVKKVDIIDECDEVDKKESIDNLKLAIEIGQVSKAGGLEEAEPPLSPKALEKQARLNRLKALGIGQVGIGTGVSGRRKSRDISITSETSRISEVSELTKTSSTSQTYKSPESLPGAADSIDSSASLKTGKLSLISEQPPRKKGRKKKEISLPDFVKEENDYGEVWFREVEFSLDHRHGDIFLRELLNVPSDVLAFMGQDDELSRMDLRRTLFLDTETTGLAGGTGTYAFLIGVGFVRENDFIVRLYFMPDYKYEPAMLQHLNDFLKDYDGLVTFNGKCYDFPLLKTRFLLNRLKMSNQEPLHLDLLHGSRRLWKKTHGSCKLTSLECSVLDFYREDDIPGQFIPEMYFQYLRNRSFKPMEKVLEHNVYDVVSMAALIVRMWIHLEMAQGGQVCGTDFFSMASIHEKRGDEELALEFYEKALSDNLNPLVKAKVCQKISRIYKRRKLFDKAVTLWTKMTEESLLDIYAHIELAKHHERITGDLEKALFYVEEACKIVERKKRTGSMTVYWKELRQINHRRTRLQKKSGIE